MAILSHVHFAILLETGVAGGMNDRFITLLDRLSLKERICNSVDEAIVKLTEPINYRKVDDSLSNYRHIGEAFLKDYFSYISPVRIIYYIQDTISITFLSISFINLIKLFYLICILLYNYYR